MSKVIKNLPLPIAGLMLALFALGNLVQTYSETVRYVFGAIGFIIFILIILKLALQNKLVMEELSNPLIFSVFPTFSMGIMLMATYIKPFAAGLAKTVFIIGFAIHIILIIAFTVKHIFNFHIKKVFPSWFIVYVGIAVASIVAPAFELASIGKFSFYFALIAYVILMVIVIKRWFFFKNVPEPALPAFAIFSAPGSLCLAGYMNSFADKNLTLFWILLVVSQLIYIAVIIKTFSAIRGKFYPSFSSFTFPLVISATALKLSNGFLMKSGNDMPFLGYLVKAEELIAVIAVVFVLIKYIVFSYNVCKSE